MRGSRWWLGAAGLLLAAKCGGPPPPAAPTAPAAPPNSLFGPPVRYEVDYWPRALAVGDLNGDGRPDFATVNDGKSRGDGGDASPLSLRGLARRLTRNPQADVGSATVWLGQGDGRFAERRDYPIGRFPMGLALTDLTGDGRPDLLTTGMDEANEALFYLLPGRRAAGGFGPPRTAPRTGILDQADNLVVGDVNADGRPDVLTAAATETSGIQVRLTGPAGLPGAAVAYPNGPHYSPLSLRLRDVTGDGLPDAVLNHSADRGLDSATVVLPGRGGGAFGAPVVYAAMCGPSALADVDGDGRPDLVAASARAVAVRRGGAGGFGPATTYPGLGYEANSLLVGDVNGDGRPDLLTTHADGKIAADGSPGPAWLALHLARPGGGWGPPATYPLGPFYAAQIRLADVNSDGRPDLLALNHNTQTVQVQLNTGR